MVQRAWQLRAVKKSLKKKEKLRLLDHNLEIPAGSVSLDLGCAQGILSYFLRQKAGFWVSADLDLVNLRTSKRLLEKNLIQIEPGPLPFRSRSFDIVVSLDYLEHLEDDDFCLREIHRVLKEDGKLVLATPRTGKVFLLHRLRPLLGLKLDYYGHKREGYSLKSLQEKLEGASFKFLMHKRFARFFTELLELILNFFYTKAFSPVAQSQLRDGRIRPSTEDEFGLRAGAFKIYSLIYPLVWLISRLDLIFFFQRGYGLLVWAKKPG